MSDETTDQKFGSADREPTEAEAEAAEKTDVDPETAEHFEEMAKIGAQTKGEGEITPS